MALFILHHVNKSFKYNCWGFKTICTFTSIQKKDTAKFVQTKRKNG